MNIRILGDSLAAWTMAGALSSTGCQVVMSADRLPDESGEIAELDLLRLLQEQHRQERLLLIPGPDNVFDRTYHLLIDARTNLTSEQRFPVLQDFAGQVPADSHSVYALVQPVAVGTTDTLQNLLVEAIGDKRVECLYWPSFIEAGRALESFTRSGRLLIGACGGAAGIALIRELMSPFNRSKDAAMVMTAKEAELTKIGINGMLATRISFMNELADLAARQGVDIESVRLGLGADPRIGHQYLYPGCGFGGEAFTDTLNFLGQELQATEHSQGIDQGLLSSVQQINEQQKDLLFQKFWRYFNADIKGRSVAFWGCAFKPNTSSIAGSPSLVLLQALLSHGVTVRVYDPMAMGSLKAWLERQTDSTGQASRADQVVYCDSPEQAAEETDAVMLITEWKLFWNQDLARIASTMNTPLLLDGRNIYSPRLAAQAGLVYSAIGRGLAL